MFTFGLLWRWDVTFYRMIYRAVYQVPIFYKILCFTCRYACAIQIKTWIMLYSISMFIEFRRFWEPKCFNYIKYLQVAVKQRVSLYIPFKDTVSLRCKQMSTPLLLWAAWLFKAYKHQNLSVRINTATMKNESLSTDTYQHLFSFCF